MQCPGYRPTWVLPVVTFIARSCTLGTKEQLSCKQVRLDVHWVKQSQNSYQSTAGARGLSPDHFSASRPTHLEAEILITYAVEFSLASTSLKSRGAGMLSAGLSKYQVTLTFLKCWININGLQKKTDKGGWCCVINTLTIEPA